jgi:hypothetical protein
MITHQNKKLLSAHPLAVAHLAVGNRTLGFRLVEWTSVEQVESRRSGPIIRHTLSPLTREHVDMYRGLGPLPGHRFLNPSDVGRTLVVDIPLDDSEEWVDVHVR